CVYKKCGSQGLNQYLAVYVDDILLLAKTTKEFDDTRRKLQVTFRIKDLGRLSYLLGVKVDYQQHTAFLHQKAYTEAMLNRSGMEVSKRELNNEEERQKKGAVVADEEPAEQTDANQQRRTQQTLDRHEAERLCTEAQQAVWLRRLYEELGANVKAPTELCEDNQGAICLASNPVGHKRTKHISIRHHYIRECVTAGLIELVYVPTQEMTADLFTKSLPTVAFQRLRACLGVVPGR
ncbi:MAG: hypothetical protein GY820_35930, partial [Gammaproteobacteria bacterium]|nr:hypothetical protein [Gammaproteobacteria bacterium]